MSCQEGTAGDWWTWSRMTTTSLLWQDWTIEKSFRFWKWTRSDEWKDKLVFRNASSWDMSNTFLSCQEISLLPMLQGMADDQTLLSFLTHFLSWTFPFYPTRSLLGHTSRHGPRWWTTTHLSNKHSTSKNFKKPYTLVFIFPFLDHFFFQEWDVAVTLVSSRDRC